MNIQILDSWLREYLKTKATPQKIGELLSLSSVSTEHLEKRGDDWLYDFEITTNRADLMSVLGIAREAAVVLSQEGIEAEYISPKLKEPSRIIDQETIKIRNNPDLVGRICTVIMEVNLKDSPKYIKERLEASGTRSLNNIIDVTNYVMLEIGHPTHVFDYDRLTTKQLEIRESRSKEKIVTLDGKEHTLPGGDIIADDGLGHIVDLLGVMGLENSVVTEETKRILFFIDSVEPNHIRQTSMQTGIRTYAAVLNEKGIDPELAMDALLRGIELYKEVADGKLLSNVIDIYPEKPKQKNVSVPLSKINSVIGIDIPEKTSLSILNDLGFNAKVKNDSIEAVVPSWRNHDVSIPEDLIEEIARIYGYHKIPTKIPPIENVTGFHISENEFYWEKRLKDALKYWGFTEVYTLSLVSEDLFEGDVKNAVTLKNPLTEDAVYMRKTLVPSLLSAVRENPSQETLKIFELANVYKKRKKDLPEETLTLGGIIKQKKISFYLIKGVIETLLQDLGIETATFTNLTNGAHGAEVHIKSETIGYIEVLDDEIVDFELNFEKILGLVSVKKTYSPISKFSPIIEDVRFELPESITFTKAVETITNVSKLITDVSLLDVYGNKKTFRIKYLDKNKQLTNEDITPIREKIHAVIKTKLKAEVV